MNAFHFRRFSDMFEPGEEPREDLVRFAVMTSCENSAYSFQTGHKYLKDAIQAAGAWLNLGRRVVIACADIREVTQ